MELQKNKRRLEQLIALLLASILVMTFFIYVQKVSIVVERESVRQSLSSIRVGIRMFILTDIVHGGAVNMRAYENTNPMQFQEKPPVNYAGEFSSEEAVKVMPGNWYYDLSARQLVYRVSHYPLFENDNRRELRYRLQFSDMAGDVFSLRLSAVEEEA